MIKLSINSNSIELKSYSDDTTLEELIKSTEETRLNRLKDKRRCRGCGRCCTPPPPVLGADLEALSSYLGSGNLQDLIEKHLAIPDIPTPDTIGKSIAGLVKDGLDGLEARLLYEYNNSEPVRFKQNDDGSCKFLNSGECSIYEGRPYACRLYTCFMGKRLSVLEEMIVVQGTWHAYCMLGLIQSMQIRHNPFLKDSGYNIKLKSFEFDFKKSLEQIFSYF